MVCHDLFLPSFGRQKKDPGAFKTLNSRVRVMCVEEPGLHCQGARPVGTATRESDHLKTFLVTVPIISHKYVHDHFFNII